MADLSKRAVTADLNAEVRAALRSGNEGEYRKLADSSHDVTITVSAVDASAVVAALQHMGTFPARQVHNIIVRQIDPQLMQARLDRGLAPR